MKKFLKYAKVHVIICLITLVLVALEISSFVFFKEEMGENGVIGNAIFSIWLICYPLAFYTCYRLIYEQEKAGLVLARIIFCGKNAIDGGVFIIPLLISPLFIVDYIIYVKRDFVSKKRLAEWQEKINGTNEIEVGKTDNDKPLTENVSKTSESDEFFN